ncbi:MAG: tRNA (guanosine(46)-N7)-methyltransferase TrmB [Spirochaetes bacterium]|nr:MAG: tRNA (guanosine(46)-N7)-methyltransferase TrmB [Spirochaetota bacterium]RKX76132.1 MAG: tRNA (guanosine(46)-N7)-methyltransferase TrmB [Spirochaetota bacterium]RKX86886.1 MAG: tRNA (guanosine(46)-N7)-methyltransferase TrmB [Spirochaetota bacterium]RKX95233.1 MAG: tRNA (guanosine(46)-N7)-methyltransferase TrmB [Spirochaetota bacterium]
MSDSFPSVRSYVIRAARMSDAQKKAYTALSPKWVLPVDGTPVDFRKLFPEAEKCIVEIGFGMGDATRQMAKEHPEWGILGVEVHKPGVGKLLWWINQVSLKNLFIIEHDAVEVFSTILPRGSVDGIHIWFPDPWPKKRHHKRRLIQADFTGLLREVLKPGGYIHAATDWEPYANHILDVFNETPGLKNRYELWADKPDYRPDTKFEHRGIEARRIIRDIIFEKE